MGHYLNLRNMLLDTLADGDKNVYFQPPASLVMKYPCIRYELDDIDAQHAGNAPYALKRGYKITIIDRDPDSDILMKVAALPTAKFNTKYESDSLNHFVFTLYY